MSEIRTEVAFPAAVIVMELRTTTEMPPSDPETPDVVSVAVIVMPDSLPAPADAKPGVVVEKVTRPEEEVHETALVMSWVLPSE